MKPFASQLRPLLHPNLQRMRAGRRLAAASALAALLLAPGCATRQLTMQSEAMDPTLPFGSSFDVDYDAYNNNRAPERYDLVIFSYERTAPTDRSIREPDSGTLICYRVVGLPGEKVEVREQQVFIDGVRLPLPGGIVYHAAPPSESNARFNELELPADAYYLLGDNSEKALDSRYWGYVRRDQIVGKVERR